MKKFIFVIAILLGMPTLMQAQTVEDTQTELEKAQKQLEEAQKAMEAAKARAEKAKAQAAQTKQKSAVEIAKEKARQEELRKKIAETKAKTAQLNAEADKFQSQVINADNIDTKYLENAVSLNADGKVEFCLSLDVPGKSADQIYDDALSYLSSLVEGKDQFPESKVAFEDKSAHRIAANVHEWMTFQSSFLSLDRAKVSYYLTTEIKDGHLDLKMSRINFKYEEDRSTGFKEPAENVITDKYALNKKKTKLTRIYGKFRRGTIDRKDDIFEQVKLLME